MVSDPPTDSKLFRHGKFLKLDCGHSIWEAGLEFPAGVNLGLLHRPCLGGCYQYQQPMGRDC